MTNDTPTKGKVIFIGDTGVGKTTLLHRLVDNQYYQNLEPTLGSGNFEISGTDKLGNVKVIHLWDTSGQERYQAITKIYFRNSDTAVLCFDSKKENSIKCVKPWLELLLNESPNCKVIFAGTKSDLLEDPSETIRNASSYLQQFNPYQILITSALSGENVDLLKSEIFASIEVEKVIHLKQIEISVDSAGVDEKSNPMCNC